MLYPAMRAALRPTAMCPGMSMSESAAEVAIMQKRSPNERRSIQYSQPWQKSISTKKRTRYRNCRRKLIYDRGLLLEGLYILYRKNAK